MKKYDGRNLAAALSALVFLCGCIQSQAGVTQEIAGTAAVDAAAQEETTPDSITIGRYQDKIERAESVYPYDGGILISNFGSGEETDSSKEQSEEDNSRLPVIICFLT